VRCALDQCSELRVRVVAAGRRNQTAALSSGDRHRVGATEREREPREHRQFDMQLHALYSAP
jgi:hypothetical protein